MGLVSDILKEIPLSAVLKEKIVAIEAENASLQTEVAILKDDLREAKAENKRLTDEINNLKQSETLPNEKLEKTLALLNSFRNALPKHNMDTSDIDEYHSLLDSAQSGLGRDLSEFRIPPSAIKNRAIAQSVSYDMFGHRSGDPYRYEKYIPSASVQRKLEGLLLFLKSQSGEKAENS